jgi:hypothetical protein
MQIQAIGLGAGSRMLAIPNILRLWIGEKSEGESGRVGEWESGRKTATNSQFPMPDSQLPMPNSIETITVLETQIDDLSPQAIGYVFDALFAAGALDVFTAPIVMKKSRLGVLLTAICHPEFQAACEAVIFRETTTLGIRRSTQQRTILHREIERVQTEYGEVQIKVAKSGSTITNVQPEYEDCAEIARLKNISWREVHRLALQSWYARS